MLHKNGGRTTQYSVDYFLAPAVADQKVYLPIERHDQAQGRQVAAIPYLGGYAGYYGIPAQMAVVRDQKEVLEEIALSLGVPVLDKEDLRGCPVCLEINGWREPQEITDEMKRNWFGAGYRQQERDRDWKEALGGS
jgi:hypothetical protein